MLIITRKVGESLIIDDNIEIVISKVQDGNVKIGIKAPKNISILRKEIYEEVKNENKAAQNIDVNILKTISGKK
jgi:carbon storage regulator